MRRAAIVFLFSILIVVSRRPDVLFHAQFWAEDGKVVYADAYNLGAVGSLFHPAAGYFVMMHRLVAIAALALPLGMVPLFFACIAVLLQVLPALFLLSSRCSELGSPAARYLFAFLCLALPNSQELHGNVSNAHWHLALLALLILFARPGGTVLWNSFDFAFLALSAMSGPFAMLFAPIATVAYLFEPRNRWRLSLLVICGIGAAVEGLALFFTGGSARLVHEVRGATPELLIQILAKQVFLAVLAGRRTLGGFSFNSRIGIAAAVAAVVAGIAIELYVLLRAPLPWKAFILFSAGILGVSLAYPMTKSPQWPILLQSGGVRYWFFPMLAFIASLLWMLQERNPGVLRAVSAALLVVMLLGVVQDWGHPRRVDLHFAAYVQKFAEQPDGTSFVIPINPAGWIMELMKR